MTKPLLLGIDIGTYSSKGVLVDGLTGETIAAHSIEHTLSMPKPGWVEHDADRVWWREFVDICHQVIAKAGIDPKEIQSVGISAVGICVLPVDKEGKPLRPAILYGIDTRSTQEIAELEQKLGREKIFETGGSYLSSQAGGPKILWIKNHEPKIYEKTRYFLTSQSYLVYRLTDQAAIDIYTASGNLPLMDVHNNEWLRSAAEYIAPIECLPKMKWSCEVVGSVTAEAARESGLAQGTPVITGTTDAAAEGVSCGAVNCGDMMIMFGSSVFFILKTEKLITTKHFWSASWLEPNSFALLGGMSTAGSLTRWFRDNLSPVEVAAQNAGGENAYTALEKLLSESSPGANGLIALPYFEGERTPLQDPMAKGLLFGLKLTHTRADVYRALLESIGYAIRHNLETMADEGGAAKKIIGVGGGTKNLCWMQMVCDIANIEMVIPSQQIGASYGDAFMAGVGVGFYKSLHEIDKWVQIKAHLYPNSENTKIYEPYYTIFRELYRGTSQQMHKLSNLMRTVADNQ
jgi:xylulokinase